MLRLEALAYIIPILIPGPFPIILSGNEESLGGCKFRAATKAKVPSDSVFERKRGDWSEAQISREFPEHLTSKRKADELSSLNGLAEAERRRPVPGFLLEEEFAAHFSASEQAVE